MQKTAIRLGTLCYLDVSGVSSALLDDLSYLKTLLLTAAKRAKVSVLDLAEHKFQPQGSTLMLLLSESHLTIHTWPEHNAACIDFFTCGPADNLQYGINYILEMLEPSNHITHTVTRQL